MMMMMMRTLAKMDKKVVLSRLSQAEFSSTAMARLCSYDHDDNDHDDNDNDDNDDNSYDDDPDNGDDDDDNDYGRGCRAGHPGLIVLLNLAMQA